jgi:hypothetical protein
MILGIRRSLYNKLPQGYITDGLVFELNASKGLSADGWVEQISGKTFTWTEGSDAVFDTTGVHIGSNVGTNGSFMTCENSTFDWIAASECSMDMCVTYVENMVNGQVFNLGITKGFAFHYKGSGYFYQCGVTQAGNFMLRTISKNAYKGRVYMNFSNSALYLNGVPITDIDRYYPRSTTSEGGGCAMLGCNADLTYPYSHVIIHAIRIYNRPLTSEEIMQNYTTDTEVFEL